MTDITRYIPFTMDDLPMADDADDRAVLDAAQDAGIALKMMREEADWSLEKLADVLSLSKDYLGSAEAGQLVEITADGRFIDMSSTLLVRVARATGHKSIPLPAPIG